MELDTTKPLTKIKNQEWVWYSENTLETVKSVWKKKEWLPVWNIVIPYDVYHTSIEEADIADRYLYFALPQIEKQYPHIWKKLRTRLKNMSRWEREELTYEWIKWYIDRQIKEEQYYQ
jgi:hypothetical protein